MKPQTTDSYHERIQRVLTHIEGHLEAPLPLEELAGIAHFSPYHFHRIFRGITGESVKEYVRRLRLERAAQRLRDSADPVLDIALDAGYETHESFTRAFQAMFGDAPSVFRSSRREWRLRNQPACESHPLPEVRIQRFERRTLAYVRHVGAYDEVGSAWQKVFAWAGKHGLFSRPFEPVGIVHDDPEITPPHRLRYDAALATGAAVQAEGEVAIGEIPPGEYAVTLHHGPYEELSETYARLCGGWLAASGREARSAPSLEFYRNLPHNTPAEDLITEICLPLE